LLRRLVRDEEAAAAYDAATSPTISNCGSATMAEARSASQMSPPVDIKPEALALDSAAVGEIDLEIELDPMLLVASCSSAVMVTPYLAVMKRVKA
jgi:hypothetical protein